MNNRFIYWLKIILLLSAIVVVEFFALCAGCILGNSKRFAEILDSNYYDASYFVQTQSLSAVSPADTTTYSFVSSNFPVYVSGFSENYGTSPDYNWSNLVSTQYVPFVFHFNTSYGLIFARGRTNSSEYVLQIGSGASGVPDVVYNSWTNLRMLVVGGGANSFIVSYHISSLFNFDVRSVNIFTAENYQARNDKATAFKFYDSNDNVLEIQFLFDDTNSQYYEYSNRTYYYLDNFSDNAYYNQGYTSGYTAGEIAGSSGGYRDGYGVGYDDGYDVGYDDGIVSSNQYTFFNLMSSVVEAPVNVFVSMLNFNIMGFNLLDLVIGLLTLAVVIVIVKLCLGGK